jgi:Sec-independent protein translocase protein TatA
VELFDINGGEFLVLLVVAVFVIGPERMPEYAAKLAKLVKQLRALADTAKVQLREQMGPEFDDVDWKQYDPRAGADTSAASLASAIGGLPTRGSPGLRPGAVRVVIGTYFTLPTGFATAQPFVVGDRAGPCDTSARRRRRCLDGYSDAPSRCERGACVGDGMRHAGAVHFRRRRACARGAA